MSEYYVTETDRKLEIPRRIRNLGCGKLPFGFHTCGAGLRSRAAGNSSKEHHPQGLLPFEVSASDLLPVAILISAIRLGFEVLVNF